MKLGTPLDIELLSETRLLLEAVDDEVSQYRSLGDFSPEVRDEIGRSFLPDRISDTLNIESFRVNPRITRAILEGQSLSQSEKYDEQEVLNVIEANDFIEELGKSEIPLSIDAIREVNRRIMTGTGGHGGALRNHDLQITGADFQPAPWGEVEYLLGVMCSAYGKSSGAHPVVAASWLHVRATEIHPFSDGNGRMARLLQDLSLIRDRLLPVGIPVARRQEYYDALADADNDDWDGIITLVSNSLITALGKARHIASAPMRRKERISALLKSSKIKKQKRDYNIYEIWRRQVDLVRDELQSWCSDLDEESPELRVNFRVYDPLDFNKWKEIRERGWLKASWLFTLGLSNKEATPIFFVFYAKRHSTRDVLETERVDEAAVAIFVTGNERSEPLDFSQYRDRYIRLRELVYQDKVLIAFRDPHADRHSMVEVPDQVSFHEGPKQKWRAERGGLLSDVVEEFIEDCLLKLGMI